MIWHLNSVRSVMDCCALNGVSEFPLDQEFIDGRVTEEGLVEGLRRRISDAKWQNRSLIMATLCNEQSRAREVLIKEGFVASDWAVRPREDRIKDPRQTRVCILYKFIERGSKHG